MSKDKRVAFVTGAASGIGREIALAFARRGAAVALADISDGELGPVMAEVRKLGGTAVAIGLDVSDGERWPSALDEVEAVLGPISILVNNAGIGGGSNVADDDPARWRRVLEVNAFGTFLGCNAILPRWIARGQAGHIVNMASLAGLHGNPGMSAYTASKFAVVGLSDALRLELNGSNIGISIVYPGMTRTNFVENSANLLRAAGTQPIPNESMGKLLASGMDPAKLAERVLQGVEEGEYHIFTHGEWKEAIKAVFDDRLAAFGSNADPNYSENFSALAKNIASTQEP